MAEQHRNHVTGAGLVDLIDRIVDRGAVVSGDVIIALAGIDMIRVDLRLLLAPVERLLDESSEVR